MRPAVSSRTRAPITGFSREGKSTAGLAAIKNIAGRPSKHDSTERSGTVFVTGPFMAFPNSRDQRSAWLTI
jgi:hypothetical protein